MNAVRAGDAPCPCGRVASGARGKSVVMAYSNCCGRLHQADPVTGPFAEDAQSLMRSRYSAFVLELDHYLLATWAPSQRPPVLTFEPGLKWLGLEVRSYSTRSDQRAEVEFVARYKPHNGPAVRLHERSRFVCRDGRWWYVDGQML